MPDAPPTSSEAEALVTAGRFQEAEAAFQQAIQAAADDLAPVIGLGNLYCKLGQFKPAHTVFSRAINMDTENAQVWLGLGVALEGMGREESAVNAWRKAVILSPGMGAAHFSLGSTLASFGDHDAAIASLRRALELMPTSPVIHSNLIVALHYASDVDRKALFDEARTWNRHFAPVAVSRPVIHNPDPERQIRVGFISDDFRFHAVAFFFLDTLACRPGDQWHATLYANQSTKDEQTGAFMKACDVWRDVNALSDEALAAQVRDDAIDILIDLDCHTKGGRLPVFAHRPAPVQATWLDYVDTTGMDVMDYIIADRYLVPPEFEDAYTEEVIRMPDDALCYSPPDYELPVSPPPAMKNGFITFGCFNTAHKISTDTAALWSKVLGAVEDSRLLLSVPVYRNDAVRHRYMDLFQSHGIGHERIEFRAGDSHEKFLAQYADVDIALDTTPYSSGLNTCEALWMGVPVIALAGDRQSARLATSHVMNAGLEDLVATSWEEYVEKAAALASDIPALAARRDGQRETVLASPLCDRQRFTAAFTSVLRSLWRRACNR